MGIFEGLVLWFSSAGQQQQHLTHKNRFHRRPQPWRPPPPPPSPPPPPPSPPCSISPIPSMHRYDSPDQLLQSSPNFTMVNFINQTKIAFSAKSMLFLRSCCKAARAALYLSSSTKSINSHIHFHQLKAYQDPDCSMHVHLHIRHSHSVQRGRAVVEHCPSPWSWSSEPCAAGKARAPVTRSPAHLNPLLSIFNLCLMWCGFILNQSTRYAVFHNSMLTIYISWKGGLGKKSWHCFKVGWIFLPTNQSCTDPHISVYTMWPQICDR